MTERNFSMPPNENEPNDSGFLRQIAELGERIKPEVHVVPQEKRPDNLVKAYALRLEKAGFSALEVAENFIPLVRELDKYKEDVPDEKILEFLATSVSDEKIRALILRSLSSDSTSGSVKALGRRINDVIEDFDEEETSKFSFEFDQFSKEIEGKEGRFTSSQSMTKLIGGVVILGNDVLRNDVFHGDLKRIARFCNKAVKRGGGSYAQLPLIDEALDFSGAKTLFDGVDEDEAIFRMLEMKYELDVDNPPKSPEVLKVINESLREGDGWDTRIRHFKPILRAGGMEMVDGAENNEEVMKRIKRRENPLHPLVSTGIARKTGWEIEFNCKTPSVQIFLRNDLRTALGIIGFKPGTGDMIKNFDDKTADEASPGPFYDPLTSMVTYAMYVDAGLINTKEFIASTCHFNASVVSIRSMVPIIRTLQLTGAGFYPHKLSGRPEMSVDANGPINDRYIESKAFSVNTDADTLWNLKSAAFLTWAAGVGEDGFDNKPGAMFRKEMDEIWTDYIFDFRDGLKSVGRSNLVYTKRNFEVTLGEREHVPDVLWLHKQLAMIYSDPTYATTPDLTKVGPATPEEMTEDGIQGIMFKGVWYPNVALFARTVVNRAVSKIEKIGQRVEENWEKDVKRIEGLHGSKRRRAVKRFLGFYGYKLEKDASDEEREAMFSIVRDFMYED